MGILADHRRARAIGPDKPRLLALLAARRRVDEQGLMAGLLADVVETNHGVRGGGKDTATRANSLPAPHTSVTGPFAEEQGRSMPCLHGLLGLFVDA